MQKIGFAVALDIIVAKDPRYDHEAYVFLRDALDFTIKQLKKNKEDISRHVSPPQLLDGVRQFAIKEFGPMVTTVFLYWGVRNSGDIGEMVFNLIRIGIFGKAETDTIEQFRNYYDFEEVFVLPFRPQKPVVNKTPLTEHPAQKFE